MPEKPQTQDAENADDYTDKIYLEYRNSLHELSVNQSNLFDTQLLAISASTLGFSIAFIDKIVPKAEAIWNSCLYMSWAFLLTSTIATLVSFQSAKKAALDYIDQLDNFYNKTGKIKENISSKSEKYTTILNTAAITFFYLGIIALLIFISVNLNTTKRKIMSTTQSITVEGANPNKPPIQKKDNNTRTKKTKEKTLKTKKESINDRDQ